MSYDLTSFKTYLEDHRPSEIVKTLDDGLYNIVLAAEYLESTEGMSSQYLKGTSKN